MNVPAFIVATLVAYFVWAGLCLRALAISVRATVVGTLAGIITYLLICEN